MRKFSLLFLVPKEGSDSVCWEKSEEVRSGDGKAE